MFCIHVWNYTDETLMRERFNAISTANEAIQSVPLVPLSSKCIIHLTDQAYSYKHTHPQKTHPYLHWYDTHSGYCKTKHTVIHSHVQSYYSYTEVVIQSKHQKGTHVHAQNVNNMYIHVHYMLSLIHLSQKECIVFTAVHSLV